MLDLLSLSRFEDSPIAIIYLITAAQMLLLGIVVCIRDFRNKSYFAFFTISLSVSIWLTCQYLYKVLPFSPEGERMATEITKIEYVGVSLISITFSYFVFSFLQLEKKYKYYFVGGLAVSTIFILLSIFTKLFLDGVYRYQFVTFRTYYARYTILGFLFLAGFVFYALFTFVILTLHYRRSGPGLRKNQMRVFLFAYCIAYTALIDFLPCLGVKVLPIGVISIYLYVLLMTRAFFKEKIFDIRNDFLIFFANILLAILLFTGIFFVLQNHTAHNFLIAQPSIITSIIVTVIFLVLNKMNSLVKPRLQEFISKKINGINSRLIEFIDIIKVRKDIDGIVDVVSSTILSSLNLDDCKIILRSNSMIYSNGVMYPAEEKIVSGIEIMQKEQIKEIHIFKDILYLQRYEIIRNDLSNLMKEFGARCNVPIFYESEFLALVTLGEKIDGSDLSESEIRFLRNIQSVFGVRLRAAILERENQQHQEHLSHAEKLATLGTVVAGVAHEINNPNNSLLLDAQLNEKAWKAITPILDKHAFDNGEFDIGGYTYNEFKEELAWLSGRMKRNSERIKRITEDLRSFAKKDVDFNEEFEINSVIRSALSVIEHVTKRSTKNLVVELCERNPHVTGNSHYLEQVIINLVKNACQALLSPDKWVFITTTFNEKTSEVIVSVRDEGRGMAEEIIKNIFTPFYTTKGAEGTGLGLSICNNIVKSHGGRIEIESNIGTGTTILVFLSADGTRTGVPV
jgi:signal transduction histidine kinase